MSRGRMVWYCPTEHHVGKHGRYCRLIKDPCESSDQPQADANSNAADACQAAEGDTNPDACHCEACDPMAPLPGETFPRNIRMILCAICGNKRCPHALNHRFACTNSNEPNQRAVLDASKPGAAATSHRTPLSKEAQDIASRRGITLGALREFGGCELEELLRRLDCGSAVGVGETLDARTIEACLAALKDEEVEDIGPEDHAYNMALEHAADAIRALGEQKERT